MSTDLLLDVHLELAATLPPGGVEHGTTEAHLAYQRLRAAILLGRLAPGVALMEGELMEALHVGRTPLREAVRLLAHDGLVEVLPRRGTYVTPVDLQDHVHLIGARRGLEAVIAERAIACATTAQIDAFVAFADAAENAGESEEVDLALDTDFHRQILEMTHNRYLEPAYWRLVSESMRMLKAAGAAFEGTGTLKPTFDAVARALEEHSVPLLTVELQTHVASFESALLDIMRRWPSTRRET